MNGFERQGEGIADSENIERESALGSSSSKWTVRSSFIGPQGIRSGWSILIFIVILMIGVLDASRVRSRLPYWRHVLEEHSGAF